MKINGHSGNKISLIKHDNKISLKKECKNNKDRLKIQSEKQKSYQPLLKLINISVPNIMIIKDDYVIMDYISNSETIIEFLEKTNHFGIEWLLYKIKCIIETFIQKSEFVDISEPFKKKLSNTLNRCLITTKDDEFINKIDNYFEKLECNFVIPVNYCHGDLTLSNMLVNQNNLDLYLIDFLNVYVESPLQDMVKLRQDTRFLWTLRLCNFTFDHNKLIIILNDMDNKLHTYFSTFPFYRECYVPFQVLNLLRIIPYSTDKSVYKFVKKCIYTLIGS